MTTSTKSSVAPRPPDETPQKANGIAANSREPVKNGSIKNNGTNADGGGEPTKDRSSFKNPIKQLIGTAKSKLKRTVPKQSNKSVRPVAAALVSSQGPSTTEPSDVSSSGKPTPKRTKKKRRAQMQRFSASEPNLGPSSASSVRESNSSLSLASAGTKTPSTGRKKGKGGRKKKVGPAGANGNPTGSRVDHYNTNYVPASASSANSRRRAAASALAAHPVFPLDIRTQNTRLVTARQRQEIYALNRVMTRLENEKFRQFCVEKGHKGDFFGDEVDIFM